MNAGNSTRIELLHKDNYDTWKLQMEALLTKSDMWEYVSGTFVKPEPGDNNQERIEAWERNDRKAKADIILSIGSGELALIKNCNTSKDMWKRLEEVYASKGPARKATLLKRLTLMKMADGEDVRAHLGEFFKCVDKLHEMEVDLNTDQLTIMLLYSLPAAFESFRIAIESRDDLPTPETLRIKIMEESEARQNIGHGSASGAMMARNSSEFHYKNKKPEGRAGDSRQTDRTTKRVPPRCFACKRTGHLKKDCRFAQRNEQARRADETSFNVSALSTLEEERRQTWCLDSGATSHLCQDSGMFERIDKSRQGMLNLASDTTTKTAGEGPIRFTAMTSNGEKDIFLKNALHVPDLRTNLLSVSKIVDNGFIVQFTKRTAAVLDSEGNTRLHADRIGDLFYARTSIKDEQFAGATSKSNAISLDLFHRRMGHTNTRDLYDAVQKGYIRGTSLKNASEMSCETCVKAKTPRTTFPRKSNRKTDTLEILHTDVCGPMRTTSMGGARYLLEFIDDHTRWCEVRLLKSKSEVFKATVDHISLVERQKGKPVKSIQSDNGREYTSREFEEFLKSRGITRRLTVPYNPEQNGVAERKNRTLMEAARCMIIDAGLPDSFWGEAVNTANHIKNRTPTKALNGRTPFEAWTGETPNVEKFRVFGCRAIYLDRTPGKGKLEPRGREGIFIGYSDQSKAYRIWSSEDRKVIVSRDVTFFENDRQEPDNENRTDATGERSDQSRRFVEVESSSHQGSGNREAPRRERDEEFRGRANANEEGNQNLRGSPIPGTSSCSGDEFEAFTQRREIDPERLQTGEAEYSQDSESREDRDGPSRRGPGRPKKIRTGSRGRPRKEYHSSANQATGREQMEYSLLSEIPIREALASQEAEEWLKAIENELVSIIANDTWTLVDRPRNTKIIGSRFVLRNKHDSEGYIEKRKARLVAQGFNQRPGVDCFETFAPVARFSSIRLLVSLAAQHGMRIHQFDIETAYLNGELDEKIHMEPPKMAKDVLERIIQTRKGTDVASKAKEMLRALQDGDKVCLLKRSLYGLRQAGRSWHRKLDSTLKELNATPTKSDPCVYRIGSGKDAVFIAVYVDDLLVAARNQRHVQTFGKKLAERFNLKDLGPAKYCLGVEFEQNDGRIRISQSRYVHDLLERFGMTECKPVTTPIDPNSKLRKEESNEKAPNVPYRELVGAINYLATRTRPDVAFAASYLGQFCNAYSEEHWRAAKRVLRYLRGTAELGLSYEADDKSLEGFVDADWGGCHDDRRSYTGYVFLLNGSAVSWESRKQPTVALSTTEAEYMALTECAKESVYLRRFLQELEVKEPRNLTVFCDNQSAIRLAENSVLHSRSKHIDLRHHFVREIIQEDWFNVDYVSTEQQIADILTKGLSRVKHQRCISQAGMTSFEDGNR